MSEVRAQRDRRLIQSTAALLSEDYPLAQLIERVCDTLCSEFDARIVFVALGDQQSQLTVEGVAQSDPAAVPDCSAASSASEAFFSGTSAYDVKGTFASPIVYRERALGVLALNVPNAKLDDQDQQLINAIARLLAITVRNQRTSPLGHGHVRGSRLGIVAAIIGAAVLTAIIVGYTVLRVQQTLSESATAARAQASDIVGQLDDYGLVATQLAQSTAQLVGPMRNDRERVESALVSMLSSAKSSIIFGVGAWYLPYTFDGKTQYYGPYAHRTEDGKITVTYEWMRPSYDFPKQPWFLTGIKAGKTPAFTDPYFDTDHVYVTTTRSFYKDGKLGGVVSVDSIVPTLEGSMSISTTSGVLATVRTKSGKLILTSDDRRLADIARRYGSSTATDKVSRVAFDAFKKQMVGQSPAEFQETLPGTGWIVRLYVRKSVFEESANRLEAIAAISVIGIWLAAILTIAAGMRTKRHAERAQVLEEQHLVLENEIAERIRAEERLREHAYRDELTGLPNRAFLIAQIAENLHALRQDDARQFALLFIDIDRFNIINDSLGHSTGDRLLAEFGQRLRNLLRPGDVLARIGGDEFVMMVRNGEQHEARRRASAINQTLRHPFTISGVEFYVQASVGIAQGDIRYEFPEEALRDADSAMYEAKRAGRSTFRVFDKSMHEGALEKLALETDLRHGLERDELFPEFQPLINLHDGSIAGFEALARWNHPTRGRVMPDEFIKVAEQSGLIVDLDERIITLACEAARDWVDDYPELFIAVNASAAHIARVDDIAIVRRALEVSGLPAKNLKVEITETAVMENGDKGAELLLGLRDIGVSVVIDDFGTGYSSLSHLQRLPVEELKIDRAFISQMIRSEKAAEIVRAILAMSKTFHMHVTAEGVETPEQAERLQRLGVDYAQGFHYGMAVNADMAGRLLRTRLKGTLRI